MTLIGAGAYGLTGFVWVIIAIGHKIEKLYGVEIANSYRFIILILLLIISLKR